jgi:hypothetical protein
MLAKYETTHTTICNTNISLDRFGNCWAQKFAATETGSGNHFAGQPSIKATEGTPGR